MQSSRLDMPMAPARADRVTTQPAIFTNETADGDPLETDFSEIGASSPPRALGDFLGARPRPSTRDGFEEVPSANRKIRRHRRGEPIVRGPGIDRCYGHGRSGSIRDSRRCIGALRVAAVASRTCGRRAAERSSSHEKRPREEETLHARPHIF